MKKILQYVLAGLLALTPAAWAIQLSDVSPDLTRTSADENLSKDYAYRVLSDLSVRRIWNLDDNRKLTIDFDPRKDSLICIVVDYRKPVSLEEADRDAADIGKFCQTFVGGGTEFFHHMGQQNRHSQAVGNAVQSAQGMANGMDIAHAAAGEGTACIESATLHILTGFQIRAILICCF